jgi:energy-coupling factor transporter ATP-binding protein EcfA2
MANAIANAPLFMKHYSYLDKGKKKTFNIFYPGTANSTPECKQNDVIVITGRKGAGKSSIAKFLAWVYHRRFPKNRVIVFSGIPGLYDELDFATSVDLKAVEEEENEKYKGDYSGVPDPSLFDNSLVIFDDVETYPNPKVQEILWQTMNTVVQNGRNYNTCAILVLHMLNRGLASSIILRELDSLIIFPHTFDNNTYNTLINHFGFDRKAAMSIYNLPERFVFIHMTHPQYLYLGTSMKKKELNLRKFIV